MADTRAIVFLRPERQFFYRTRFGLEEYLEPPTIYGCAYSTRRSFRLGEPLPKVGTPEGIGPGIELETLAGTMVAYEEGEGRPSGATWIIVVRDLRNGRVIHKVPTGVRSHPIQPPRQYVGLGPATGLAVKSNGSVAWLVETTAEEGSFQLHALDRSGGRLLASGSDIARSSLALAGNTLYWTQGGRPFSAPLN
jgi:hypothetical protein